jgi:hypothetical protein
MSMNMRAGATEVTVSLAPEFNVDLQEAPTLLGLVKAFKPLQDYLTNFKGPEGTELALLVIKNVNQVAGRINSVVVEATLRDVKSGATLTQPLVIGVDHGAAGADVLVLPVLEVDGVAYGVLFPVSRTAIGAVGASLSMEPAAGRFDQAGAFAAANATPAQLQAAGLQGVNEKALTALTQHPLITGAHGQPAVRIFAARRAATSAELETARATLAVAPLGAIADISSDMGAVLAAALAARA